MKQRMWFALVVTASLSAAAAISLTPRRDQFSEVQQCGKHAAPVHPPRGHVACSLKNGKVIFLRSPK